MQTLSVATDRVDAQRAKKQPPTRALRDLISWGGTCSRDNDGDSRGVARGGQQLEGGMMREEREREREGEG